MKKFLIFAIASVFACGCITACTTVETTSSEEDYTVVVPDFTNEHIDDVMEKYGDTFNITTYYYAEEGYEKGIVFEQNRASGIKIKKGEDICLFVSDGEIPTDTTRLTVSKGADTPEESADDEDTVQVPDFIGKHINDIDEICGDSLDIKFIYYSKKGYEENVIYDQSISSGRTVDKGTTIALYVSDGTSQTDTSIADSETAEPETINYPLVYEDDNVKIEYCGIEEWYYSECVVFCVTNKNDFEITIQCSSISLDGIQIDGDPTMSDEVAPQSKAKVYAKYDSIENKEPTSISGVLRVIDFSRDNFDSYDATFVNVEIK